MTAAGIVENFVAHDYPTAKIRKLLDINVMGTWFCALEAAKRMEAAGGGSIVMIGSMSGSVSAKRALMGSVYSCSTYRSSTCRSRRRLTTSRVG